MSEYQFLKEGPVRELSEDEIVAFLEVFKKLAKNKRNEWKKELHPEFKKQIAKWNDENKERKAENKKVMEQDQEEEAEEVQVDVLSDEDIIKVIKACRDGRDFIELQSERAEVLEYCKEYGINSENFADVEEPKVEPKKERKVNKKMNIMSFKELRDDETVEDVDFLIDDFIQKKAINYLVGFAESGKTTLAMAIAQHGACTKEFLKRKINTPFKTLYIDAEKGRASTKFKFWRLVKGHGFDEDIIKERCFVDSLSRFKLEETWVSVLKEQIQKYGFDLIIIDNIRRTFIGRERDESDVKLIHDLLKPLCEELGVTFLILHHTVKSGQWSNVHTTGSGDFTAHAEIALLVKSRSNYGKRQDEHQVQHFSMKMTKSNDMTKFNEFRFDIKGTFKKGKITPLSVVFVKDEKLNEIGVPDDFIDWCAERTDFKSYDIDERFEKIPKSTRYLIIENAIEEGIIERVKRGHYHVL